MNNAKEVKIGVIIVVALGLLVYGFYFLKGEDIFQKKKQYYAEYSHISGLGINNNVQVSGFNVGKINSIEFNRNGKGTIVVGFFIDNPDVNIPVGSIARIESLDLLGTKVIAIEYSDNMEMAQNKDTLYSDVESSLEDEVSETIAPLKIKTEELLGSIDSAVTIVQAILNKDARTNLSQSFESIKRAINTFEIAAMRLDTLIAEDKIKLDRIFSNLESITGNVRNSNEDITAILDNFASISDTLAQANLAQTVMNANNALSQVADVFDKINRGEGSLGNLVHNDTLYTNIEQASLELDKLLEDMRINPERYVHLSVFGRREKKEDKPEKKPRP